MPNAVTMTNIRLKHVCVAEKRCKQENCSALKHSDFKHYDRESHTHAFNHISLPTMHKHTHTHILEISQKQQNQIQLILFMWYSIRVVYTMFHVCRIYRFYLSLLIVRGDSIQIIIDSIFIPSDSIHLSLDRASFAFIYSLFITGCCC